MPAPNLLLIVIDSLRADAVFGNDVATPVLDSRARLGAAFVQCVSTTTSTTPSFSSLLTGCYPPRHGVRGLQGYKLSSSVATMAERFAAAGYETHAEVTGPLVAETGVLRGFADARHRPGYRAEFMVWTDEVMGRMRSYTAPWLLLVHVWEVHRPYRSPPDYAKRWDKAGYQAAVTAVDRRLAPLLDSVDDHTVVVVTGDHGEDYPDTRFEQRLIRAARRARGPLRLGRWLPRLDNRLQAAAVGHGFALHEQLVRVPLLVCGPGVEPVVVADQVRHIDVLPTVAELCGLPPPPGVEGRSLTPLMRGATLPQEPAYMEAVGVKLDGRRIEGARTEAWKLLRRPDGARPSLHRIDRRGAGKRDLALDHPDIAATLEAFLDGVASSGSSPDSGMTTEEEAVVEAHLRDLGYL